MDYTFKSSDIIFATKEAAETIIKQLIDIANNYGQIFVTDLKDLAGMYPDYNDTRYGWLPSMVKRSDMGPLRVRDGWIINLPTPLHIATDSTTGAIYISTNSTEMDRVEQTDSDDTVPIHITMHTKLVDDPAEVIAEVFKYAYTIKDRVVNITIM